MFAIQQYPILKMFKNCLDNKYIGMFIKRIYVSSWFFFKSRQSYVHKMQLLFMCFHVNYT